MDRAAFACSTAFFHDYSSASHDAVCLPQGHVDYIEKVESFSYSDFFRDYLIPNHPCVFSAKFTEGWGSRRNWVTRDGKPNFDYLLQHFGKAVVPVANCDVKEYNSNPKEQIPLKEYISYWKEYIKKNYHSPRGCLYLKDWHLYRTPFHADVFRSYSWSANICGKKKWLLYPPRQEYHLRDRHGNLPFDVTAPGLQDSSIYPRYAQSCPPVEIIQEAGEIVFIPSGWHHQVYNLEDTISINHNWVNGCNVAIMWSFLQDELAAVQREISEWKDTMEDWHLQCQVIMKSCTGINYKEFYNFLKVIAENRISVLNHVLDEEASAKNTHRAATSALGMLHAVFDLKRTVQVLTSLNANEDFKKLNPKSLSPPPEALLHHLKAAIDTALL
ncbi:2-oxoglutarate and iron-dependent oxygenase JMJD4 isoform X3 [Gopherus flavomarginatus]|uniref:2-oxoglutarate and iron-dependent oxygenase JMJD4 isoform X3 n=1 Tax=Gopherus flavomarginatus TaxID=286002 RepID=UPI0021CB9A94|nr:2-oxoglutarate and iron-dependent oxygenase JMJD4 isoform X3 [Gopherus flavomarginatus]